MGAPPHLITPIAFVKAAALDHDRHRACIGMDASKVLNPSAIRCQSADLLWDRAGLIQGALARVP
jgi:hypothetical protein